MNLQFAITLDFVQLFLQGQLLENVVDIKFISAHLGNLSIGITCDTHLTVTKDSKQKVANKSSLYFLNASPYTFSNWNTLNNTQSKIYIAIGLRVKETTTSANSWYSINAYNPIYATDITSKTLLGILSPNGAFGSLALSARHGLAFDVVYTARHNLVLVFETI